MQGAGIVAGLRHVRPELHFVLDPVLKRPRAIVQVPVVRFGQFQPLRQFQADRLHVLRIGDHRRDGHGLRGAEFGSLLHQVDQVLTRAAEPQHLRAGGLRLNNGTGEIGGLRERIAFGTNDLTARSQHEPGRIALQRLAEGIVRKNEIPAGAARLHDCGTGRFGGHIGIVHPVYRIWRTGLAGNIRCRRAGGDHHLVLFLDQRGQRQRGRRRRAIHDNIDAVLIEPAPGDRDRDIRFVEMVRRHNLDIEPGGAEFQDSLFGANDRSRAIQIAIGAGLVVDDAEFDHRPRLGASAQEGYGGGRSRGHYGRASCKIHREDSLYFLFSALLRRDAVCSSWSLSA